MGCLDPLIEFQHLRIIFPIFGINCFSRLASALLLGLGVLVRSALYLLTLLFPTRTLSTLPFFTLVDSALYLTALSSSSTSGLCAKSDSVGTLFSSVVCRSALSVWWASPSTPSVAIFKETFFPTIFYWFRERMESSLKTSLLRNNFGFSGSHSR